MATSKASSFDFRVSSKSNQTHGKKPVCQRRLIQHHHRLRQSVARRSNSFRACRDNGNKQGIIMNFCVFSKSNQTQAKKSVCQRRLIQHHASLLAPVHGAQVELVQSLPVMLSSWSSRLLETATAPPLVSLTIKQKPTYVHPP
jgi:hypothetical protein